MTNSIMVKSALNAAAGLSLLLVGFVCSIVVARLLGPEANGVIAFSLWLALTASLVAELGTGVTLMKILPQLKVKGFSEEQRRGFASRMLRPILLSTVIFLVVYAGVNWLAEHEHWAETAPTVVVITGLLFFIQSIGSFSKNYLIGEQAMVTFFRITAAAGGLQLIGVVLGTVFFGLEGALGGYIGGHIIQFVYSLRILRSKPDPCGVSTRYLINSSFLLSLEFFLNSVFLTRLEYLFLQQYQGIATVGLYAAAASLANLAIQLPTQLTGSLLPYYSEQLEESESAKLPASVFEGVVRSLSYVTLPMSFGLAAIAPRLVELFLGSAYEASGQILATLALVSPIYVFNLVCTQYLLSHDMVRERVIILAYGSVLMTVSLFLLIPWLGGEGAAIARFIVFLFVSILMLRKMEIGVSLKHFLLPIGRVGLAAFACAMGTLFVLYELPGVLGLVLAIVAGAITYCVALRIFRAVPGEDRQVLELMAQKLPGSMAKAAHRVVMFIAGGPAATGRSSQ